MLGRLAVCYGVLMGDVSSFLAARSSLAMMPEWQLAHVRVHLAGNHSVAPGLVRKLIHVCRECSRLLYRWLSRTGLEAAVIPPATVCAYVATANQLKVILPILRGLVQRGHACVLLVDPALWSSRPVGERFECVSLCHSASILLLSAVMVLQRLGSVARWCLSEGRVSLLWTGFSEFFQAYPLLLLLTRLWRVNRPELLLFANDHTPDASAVWLSAFAAGIKTAYVQHAFVTDRYPPLRASLNFLYGTEALNRYIAAGRLFSGEARVGLVEQVVLSGYPLHQPVRSRCAPAMADGLVLGIGLNPLDDLALAQSFVTSLARFGCFVRIRLHPRFDCSKAAELSRRLSAYRSVDVVAAGSEPLSCFLDSISILVACESSLLLDGFIAGVPSYQGPLQECYQERDSFGFIRQGIVPLWLHDAPSDRKQLDAVLIESASWLAPVDALSGFSYSLLNSLKGMESECVASWLSAYLSGSRPWELGTVLAEEAPWPVYAPDPSRCLADRP